MSGPLKPSNHSTSPFDINEILQNPSIFSKDVLSKQTNKSPNQQSPPSSSSTTTMNNQSKTIPNPTSSSTTLKRKSSIEDGCKVTKRFVNAKATEEIRRRTMHSSINNNVDSSDNKQQPVEDRNENSNINKKTSFENYHQKSSIKRFNESSYNMMEIIQRKRALHNSIPASSSATSNSSSKSKNTKNNKANSESSSSSNKQSNLNQPNKSVSSSSPSSTSVKTAPELVESRQDFLYDILNWNTNSFKNTTNDTPPTVCEEPAQKLKLSYSSVDEYIKFYKPLVLHEIWAQIAERIEALKKIGPCKAELFVNLYEIEDNFLILNCVLPVTNDDYNKNNYPIEGDLIVIELSVMKDQTQSEKILKLGYISEHVVDEITEKTMLHKRITYPSTCKKLLRYIIKLKLMNVKIDIEKNVRCSSIYYLKPKLKQCEALTYLDRSALCLGIINPESQIKSVKINKQLETDPKFNNSQLNVIYNTNELVNSSTPGILLVQGPPGTGKTHTLIGMVKKIFLDWKERDSCPKILICAPSNGAIDEIGRRLHKERDFLKLASVNRALRIVRIGQEESMNEFVRKNLFIDSLVDKNVKMKQDCTNNFHLGELEEKEREHNELILKANALERNKEFDELKQVKHRIGQLKREIAYLEKSKETREKEKANLNNDVSRKKCRNDLLSKADVILTTLSSCCNSSLLQVFNERQIFNCCIIDEASQCSEPEILMPLSFNSISKLILIGDPMQLPATTISTVANKYGFGTSLFERFYKYIQSISTLNQYYIMLNIQYRMHSEICSLPSRLFYNNRLGTDSKTDKRNFPLVPYMIFDVKGTTECKRNVKNIHNTRESNFVIKLTDRCVNIIESCKRFDNNVIKIGIITPYQGQRKLLMEGFKQYEKSVKVKIEVNTIDGFQGREMDVIIISAVRSFGDQGSGSIGFLNSHQRLNVGITRAKCSLFICLNADSLTKNALWNQLIEDARQRDRYRSCFAEVDDDFLNNIILSQTKTIRQS